MRANEERRGIGQTIEVSSKSVRGLRELDAEQIETLLREGYREYRARFAPHEDIVLPIDGERVDTTDLSLAAYYAEAGLPLLDVFERPRTNGSRHAVPRVCFRFVGKPGEPRRLRMDYFNGPASAYDARVRALKKMVHEADTDGR